MTEDDRTPKRSVFTRTVNGAIAVFTLGLAVLIALTLAIRDSAQAGSTDPLAVSVVVTDRASGQELAAQPGLELSRTPPAANTPVISVNTFVHEQKITGFGAAMTDSSASLISRLSNDTRYALLDDLFGSTSPNSPSGRTLSSLHLNVLRIPIGASDFTANGVPYTYDDGSPDPSLQRFSIEHDRAYILSMLRKAQSHNWNLRFLATPWSMPAWMKANDNLDNRHNAGSLLPQYAKAYAQYFVEFLQRYAKAGIDVSAITPANEPTNPTRYPGMNISAAEEVKLIDEDLVPALRSAGLQTRVYGGDLNWYDSAYASTIATSAAADDVIGVAWHCYFGNPDAMSEVHDLDSTLETIVSECSPGASHIPIPEVIIASLRNWASQVDLWNLALDRLGGPVQPPNSGCQGCSGLVTVDDATDSYVKNASYYELGQASEFIQPGASRVLSNTFVSYHYKKGDKSDISPGVDDVAVANPDGSVALMAYNNSTAAKTFAVKWHDYFFSYTLAPGATASFLWRKPG